MKKELVSIIVPIYNVEKFLCRCIDSLLAQSYEKIEIILIDDGSPDSCPNICDNYSLKYDNIHTIHKKNEGVSFARNIGLDIASGKYICFVDPDDSVDIDYVNKLVHIKEKFNADFCYCGMNLVEQGCIKEKKMNIRTNLYSLEDLYEKFFFGSLGTNLWQGLFERKIIEDNQIRFDGYIRRAEDFLFYSQYLLNCKNIAILDEALYFYEQNPNSIMHKYIYPSDLGIEKGKYILEKFKKNMKDLNVPVEWYNEHIMNRYAVSIIRYGVSMWDSRNNISIFKKHKNIKRYIKKYKIYEYIVDLSVKNKNMRNFIEILVAKSRSAILLDLYAIIYCSLKKYLVK